MGLRGRNNFLNTQSVVVVIYLDMVAYLGVEPFQNNGSK